MEVVAVEAVAVAVAVAARHTCISSTTWSCFRSSSAAMYRVCTARETLGFAFSIFLRFACREVGDVG